MDCHLQVSVPGYGLRSYKNEEVERAGICISVGVNRNDLLSSISHISIRKYNPKVTHKQKE